MSALTDTFTAIANAIRAKLGVSTTYTPAQMASAIASIPKAVLQTKTQTVTPSANWSGTNTNNATISPDSGYDGMSQINVNVPMLRDNTLMTADTVDTPGTVYNGNTSESNSQKLLRMHPTKDGMSYTGSYLYMKPNSYLGNATASDVASGKTFSSASGIQVTGTGSSGTDTSDATLDSGSRMLSGYTAYARGTKYTGSITSRSASSETISSAKTYSSGYYPSSWTVTPSGGSGTDTSDATVTSGNQILYGYSAYSKGTKYNGTIYSYSPSSIMYTKDYFLYTIEKGNYMNAATIYLSAEFREQEMDTGSGSVSTETYKTEPIKIVMFMASSSSSSPSKVYVYDKAVDSTKAKIFTSSGASTKTLSSITSDGVSSIHRSSNQNWWYIDIQHASSSSTTYLKILTYHAEYS